VPFADLGRLLLAAALCGGVARLCLVLLPGALSLPAAVLAGMVTYMAAIRVLRALPAGDIDRLRAMGRSLPVRLRRSFEYVLRLLGGNPGARADLAHRDIAATRVGIRRARNAD
jgi:hypothetical protein